MPTCEAARLNRRRANSGVVSSSRVRKHSTGDRQAGRQEGRPSAGILQESIASTKYNRKSLCHAGLSGPDNLKKASPRTLPEECFAPFICHIKVVKGKRSTRTNILKLIGNNHDHIKGRVSALGFRVRVRV